MKKLFKSIHNMAKKAVATLAIASVLFSPQMLPEAHANAFTNIFGGSPVSPADVAYANYSFSSNLTLVWPQFTAGSPNVIARFMNMTPSTSGLNVSFPNAKLSSVGYDTIIFNAGASPLNILGFTGATIATVPPGQTYYIILKDNTTTAGTWQTVQFGVGSSSLDAAGLAGAGLIDLAGLLNVNLQANSVMNSFTLTNTARGLLYVWTGGSGVITLPNAASVGNGFFFMIANNGSGSVSVTPSSGTIDGNSSSTFSQTQSGFIMSNGSNWFTVGKGIQNTFAVTLLNLNVSGNTDITETSAQAQNIIQNFTGALTGNINVIVPNTVQLYFVDNATSGAFSLTVKTAAGTGIPVPQNSNAILYCDGTNVVNAFTASVSGSLSLVSGSSVSPPISFQNSPTTGIYSAIINTISATAGGNEVVRWLSAASSVNHLTESASATGNPLLIGAAGTDGNIPITITGKGTGTVNIPAANITGGNINNTVIGNSTAGAITGTTITGSSFVGPLTGNVTGNLTGNVTGNVTGSASLNLLSANNLSDVASPATALSNIGGAPLNSPAFTGTPTLPSSTQAVTQSQTNNSTQVATTAFVNAIARGANAFASNNTFVTPSNTSSSTVFKFTITGGGGAGGGSSSGGGSGGGAGTTGIYYVTTVSPGVTFTITIGGGGSGNTGAGNTGGTSSISAPGIGVSCPGGGGGNAANNNAGGLAGGNCVNASLNINGGGGASGYANGAAAGSGIGGASMWGGGGSSVTINSPNNGIAGLAYGSGGGGAYSSGTPFVGGAGAGGLVLVEWY